MDKIAQVEKIAKSFYLFSFLYIYLLYIRAENKNFQKKHINMSCGCGGTKVQKNPVKQVVKRIKPSTVGEKVRRAVNRPTPIKRPAR